MADRKYYVLCEANCKFESMTKEQILTAIEQAISKGEIKDVDTGFVTTLKERNGGKGIGLWIGSQADYNADVERGVDFTNVFCIFTDDTTEEEILAATAAAIESATAATEAVNGLKEAEQANAEAIAKNSADILNIQEGVEPLKDNYDVIFDGNGSEQSTITPSETFQWHLYERIVLLREGFFDREYGTLSLTLTNSYENALGWFFWGAVLNNGDGGYRFYYEASPTKTIELEFDYSDVKIYAYSEAGSKTAFPVSKIIGYKRAV